MPWPKGKPQPDTMRARRSTAIKAAWTDPDKRLRMCANKLVEFTPEMISVAVEMRRAGGHWDAIADRIGVSSNMLRRWRRAQVPMAAGVSLPESCGPERSAIDDRDTSSVQRRAA